MKLLKVIPKLFYILVFTKKIFSKPKKSEILIFDRSSSEFIIPSFKKIKYEILDIRFYDKNNTINFYIIAKNILRLKFSFYEYVKSYIHHTQPKIIISVIDNNKFFYKLKKIYPTAKTIIIQNSWRSIKTDIFDYTSLKTLRREKHNRCDFILSFNKKIGLKYQSFSKGKVIPIGSIRSNASPINNKKKTYKYTYISIFRPNLYLKPEDEVLLSSINKYFHETKKKLYVLGSSILSANDEYNFYRKHFKNINFTFIAKTKQRKTYKIIDTTKIILSLESTLAYEALSRGIKVLFFSLRTNEIPSNGELFGWPYKKKLNGEFWTTRLDVQAIKEKISYLERLNNTKFKKILKKNTENFLIFDFDNLVLKRLVDKLIKNY